jgi:divalent metal cation (Fe/Co/Zn/Cd) transporter
MRPEELSHVAIGVAVIVVSAGLEGASWRVARRELKAEADARHLPIGEHMATSSNPTPSTVFLEDTAALIGLALALVALGLHAVTGSAVPDAVASLLIGLLLIAVSFLLVRRNAALLIDESAPADVRERLRAHVMSQFWVDDVPHLTAVRIGPNQLLVIVHLVPGCDASAIVGHIDTLRRELLALPVVTQVEITPYPAPPDDEPGGA